MDSKVSEFLKSGKTDATSRSHRYAAKSYSEFLLAQIKARDSDRMQYSKIGSSTGSLFLNVLSLF